MAECGYELLLRPPYSKDIALLFVPTAERTLKWHTFSSDNDVTASVECGGLSSGARLTLLQDWCTKAAETMEQVH